MYANRRRTVEWKNSVNPLSFSPDGKRLVYAEQSPETRGDVWAVPLDLRDAEHPTPGKPEPFLHTAADENYPRLSPDGRWMAYGSDESGAYEVYVRPFPGPGGKWQISTGGGGWPIWSRDGRELFYASQDNRIMVAEYMAKGESFSYAKLGSGPRGRSVIPGARISTSLRTASASPCSRGPRRAKIKRVQSASHSC